MKRRTLISMLVVLAVVFFAGALACGSSNIEKYYDKISDYRSTLLTASTDKFDLFVVSGVHETPYVLDGVSSGKKTPYAVFRLVPKTALGEVTLSGTLCGTSYALTLGQHPFKNEYTAEVEETLPSAPLDVTVCGETVTLTPIVDADFCSAEYALTLALEQVKPQNEDFELQLRIVRNDVTGEGKAYWYVAFVRAESTTSLLVSGEGEIVALRG